MTTDWKTAVANIPDIPPLANIHNQWWAYALDVDVQKLAHTMLAFGARLSAITGTALDNGETCLIYHYAVADSFLNVKVHTKQNTIESITPIIQAAAWAEREIRDLYGATFVGHPNPSRLLRPSQLPEGFFRAEDRRKVSVRKG